MHLDHSQSHRNLKSVAKAAMTDCGVQRAENYLTQETQNGVKTRWHYLSHFSGPGCPGTLLEQADLEPRDLCLPLLAKFWD